MTYKSKRYVKGVLFLLLTPVAFVLSMVYMIAAALKAFCEWWWTELFSG